MAALVDILAAGVVGEDGEALVNGVVYFYERGTTTKVTVYQDAELTVPYPNPLTLDDAGKAEVYIQTPVRIVIEDSLGNQIDDISNVGEVATLGEDLIIGTDSSNYLIINSKIRSNLIPDSPSVYTIGNEDYPWKEIHLDGESEHGGRIYGDASLSKYFGFSNDGDTFEIVGPTDSSVPAGVANGIHTARSMSASTVATSGNIAISNSCGAYSRSTASYADITNLSVTITTSGRPVILFLMDSATSVTVGGVGQTGIRITNTTDFYAAYFKLVRDSTDVSISQFYSDQSSGITYYEINLPASTIKFVDTPAAGTYVYKVQVNPGTGPTVYLADVKLVAYEL